jgi:spermidine synthase
VHGTIDHGTQLFQPGSARIPTSYFGYSSGVTRAIRAVGRRGPIKLGILGLGAGVTASLARAGDTLHYYEINPLVLDIATHQFGFLPGCPADKQVYLGDGRLVLESLPDEHLDFFALDAFTSDSVPVHLLTREAYKTYLRHLKPDGVMAVNISNRYLDLGPVVAQAMTEMGWSGVTVDDEGQDEPFYSGNTWVVLARSPQFFDSPSFKSSSKMLKPKPGFRTWTDDFSNLIQILK